MSAEATMSSLPRFDFLLKWWERKVIQERDENGNPILGTTGVPIVLDSWVLLHLVVPGSTITICVEVELEAFEKYVLPRHIDGLIAYWRGVSPNTPDYVVREERLRTLHEYKHTKKVVYLA